MAGVIVTTTVSGRIITRTGRYKAFPIIGTAHGGGRAGAAGHGRPGDAAPLVLAACCWSAWGSGW